MHPGSRVEGQAPAGLRRAAWLGLSLALLGSLAWSVHPWYDPTNDGSMYIATARSLVAGEGYRYLDQPFQIRPPGFSCLIAPLLACVGTNFFALNLFVSLWGALGVLAFHFLLRARLGLLLATLLPLLLWFNPGYQRLCNQVMSDIPGWTLLVGCLGLALRQRRRASPKGALLLGIVIGLTSYVRSGNLLLVPAVLVADALHEALGARAWLALARRSGACLAGLVLVLAPWSIRNRVVAPPPPADQTLLYSYASGMWHQDMGDPNSPRVPLAEVFGRIQKQGPKSLFTLGTRLQESGSVPIPGAFAAALILALLLAAAIRREPEELFALGTLLVVAFYFGYAGRLLLPVFALAVTALFELVQKGFGRMLGARAGTAIAAFLALAWIGLDWHPRANWESIEALHRAYTDHTRLVRAELPAEARLGAWRGWHHSVYLERPVYGFEQACQRAGSPAASEAIIDRYGLDTVLLTPLGLPPSVQLEEREFAAYMARRHAGPELGLVRVR